MNRQDSSQYLLEGYAKAAKKTEITINGDTYLGPNEAVVLVFDSVCFASQARIVDRFTKDTIINELEYIAAYQKFTDKYENNQTTMEDYLEAIRKLKETYLKEHAGAALPVVP